MPAFTLRKQKYLISLNKDLELLSFAFVYVVQILKVYKLNSSFRWGSGRHKRLCESSCSMPGCGNRTAKARTLLQALRNCPRSSFNTCTYMKTWGFRKARADGRQRKKKSRTHFREEEFISWAQQLADKRLHFKFEVGLSCAFAIKPCAQYMLVCS